MRLRTHTPAHATASVAVSSTGTLMAMPVTCERARPPPRYGSSSQRGDGANDQLASPTTLQSIHVPLNDERPTSLAVPISTAAPRRRPMRALGRADAAPTKRAL